MSSNIQKNKKPEQKIENTRSRIQNNSSKTLNISELKLKTVDSKIKEPKLVDKAKVHIEKNKDFKGAYGTGKRKNAIARVWVRFGSGKINVNNKLLEEYFSNDSHKARILSPFIVTSSSGQYDVFCTVKGGGSSGQADAIRHGISKALAILTPDFHKTLRDNGFLTRDARVVERKKYGKHKARKSTQFSKR